MCCFDTKTVNLMQVLNLSLLSHVHFTQQSRNDYGEDEILLIRYNTIMCGRER